MSRLSIQPVCGRGDRRLSSGVLDTAESLMQNIDQLAEVLHSLTGNCTTELEEQNSVITEGVVATVRDPQDDTKDSLKPTMNGSLDVRNSQELNLFRRLKSCLDSTRHLIESLQREKSRLMKREMSVECKLGEIEDYKSHVKQDLSSLNEMVDLLTTKVFTLETQLCEELEKSQNLMCDRQDLEVRLSHTEKLLTAEEERHNRLKLENRELKYQNEVLVVENAKLKEFLREKTEGDDSESKAKPTISKDRKLSLPDLIENSNSAGMDHINEETVTIRL